MTKFKKFRIGLWFILLFIALIAFIYAYGEGIAPLFYSSFVVACVLNGIIRIEFD